MDLVRPATTTEARALLGMVQYYRDMWPRRSHVLDPMTEAAIGPKDGKILWNDALESSFKELKHMCSIPCIFDTDRGSSLAVNYRTTDVRVTSDRPGTP